MVLQQVRLLARQLPDQRQGAPPLRRSIRRRAVVLRSHPRGCKRTLEARRNRVWYKWFRFSFKTTMVAKNGSLWLLSRDELETIAIFTHKIQQVGESMGGDLLDEIKGNETLRNHWPQFRKLAEASDTRITVDRGIGPKEPSISVMPVLGSATSGHYTRIFNDDVTNDVIIEIETTHPKSRPPAQPAGTAPPRRHPCRFPGNRQGRQRSDGDPREGRLLHEDQRAAGLPERERAAAPIRRSTLQDKRKGIRDEFEWNAQFMLRIVAARRPILPRRLAPLLPGQPAGHGRRDGIVHLHGAS